MKVLRLSVLVAAVMIMAGCDMFSAFLSETIVGDSLNPPPVADASATTSEGIVNNTIILDASKSTNEGGTLSYQWELIDAPNASTIKPWDIIRAQTEFATFIPDVAGTYQFTLTVSDGTSVDSVLVVIIVIGIQVESPPEVPRNLSPLSNSTSVNTALTLGWSASGGAETYQINLGTSNTDDDGDGVMDTTEISAETAQTAYDVSGLEYETTYYWQVIAKNSVGETPSGIIAFTTKAAPLGAPGVPSSLTPQDGAGNVSTLPEFSWDLTYSDSNPEVPEKYLFTLAEDAEFTIIVNELSEVLIPHPDNGDLSYTLDQPLENEKLYYWRLEAVNGAGNALSPIQSFTTKAPDSVPPSAATNPSPGAEAVDQPLSVDLSWSGDGTADYYDVLVSQYKDSDEDGDDDLIGSSKLSGLSGTTIPNSNLGMDLDFSARVEWQVIAVNSAGQTEGPLWSFTTKTQDANPAVAPSLLSPADQALISAVNVDLKWSSVDDATKGYRVYFGTSTPPAKWGDDTMNTAVNTGPLAPDTTYYWAVSSLNEDADGQLQEGPLSPVRSFTTIPVPGVFSLISPSTGAVDQKFKYPPFTWEQSSNASTYTFELTKVGSTTSEEEVKTVSTYYTSSLILEENTEYTWSVTASNVFGEVAATGEFSFTTGQLPGSFSLLQPGEGDLNVPFENTSFDWGDSIDADSYTLEVYNNAGDMVFGKKDILTSQYTLTEYALAPKTDYVWTVTAVNIHGVSKDKAAFTTMEDTSTLPPGDFTLISPADGAQNIVPVDAVFEWGASENATSYDLLYGLTEDYTDKVTGITGLKYKGLSLKPETTYYWYIAAKNSNGTNIVGPAKFSTSSDPTALQWTMEKVDYTKLTLPDKSGNEQTLKLDSSSFDFMESYNKSDALVIKEGLVYANPSTTLSNPELSTMTINGWFYWNPARQTGMSEGQVFGIDRGWQLEVFGDQLILWDPQGNETMSIPKDFFGVAYEKWTMLTLTINNETRIASVYIDGDLVDSVGIKDVFVNNGKILIGGKGLKSGTPLALGVDDFTIFLAELSKRQVSDLFQSLIP